MFISNDRAQSQSLYHHHNGKQCKDGQCVYVCLVASNSSFKLDQTCIRKGPNIHMVSHVTHPTNISQAKFCKQMQNLGAPGLKHHQQWQEPVQNTGTKTAS